MTMIAYTTNFGFPVLIGDLLVSSFEGGSNLKTPVYLNGTNEIITDKLGRKPSGLNQKLYIINESLCVGFGGNNAEIFSYLNRLSFEFGNKSPDYSQLLEFIEGYPKEKTTNLFAIFVLAEKINNRISISRLEIGEWTETEHSIYDKIIVSGSGAKDYLEAVTLLKSGHEISEHGAILNNINLINMFLGFESYSPRAILKNWGGGFQIITYSPTTGFYYLDNFNFLNLVGTYSKKEGLNVTPIHLMTYKYYKDLLIIRSGNAKVEISFGALPINKNKKDYNFDEIAVPNFESPFINVFLYIKLENGGYLPFGTYVENNALKIQIKTEEGQAKITCTHSYRKELEEQIRKLI